MTGEFLTANWPLDVIAGTTLKGFGGGFRAGQQRDQDIRRLEHYLGSPLAVPHQVHGTHTAIATPGEVQEADALFSTDGHLAVAVVTADCLPVMMVDPRTLAIAACHAGWRGLAAGVVENALARFHNVSGVYVWIGPAICQRHFEVGADVLHAFSIDRDVETPHFKANDRGRWQCDLVGIAASRLKRAGVRHIYRSEECTFCDPQRFYSHRRDGAPHRHCSFVAPRPSI